MGKRSGPTEQLEQILRAVKACAFWGNHSCSEGGCLSSSEGDGHNRTGKWRRVCEGLRTDRAGCGACERV